MANSIVTKLKRKRDYSKILGNNNNNGTGSNLSNNYITLQNPIAPLSPQSRASTIEHNISHSSNKKSHYNEALHLNKQQQLYEQAINSQFLTIQEGDRSKNAKNPK